MTGARLGEIRCDPEIEVKLRRKTPSLTSDDVREALLWPAEAQSAWEDDPEHGRRLIVLGAVATGRRLIAFLLPLPDWDDETDTWIVKTARWVDND